MPAYCIFNVLRCRMLAIARPSDSQLPFNPFYWRPIRRARHPIAAELCAALGLGLLFLVPHLITSWRMMFRDLSWMVGVLIFSATSLLYYATFTLINTIAEVEARTLPQARKLYTKPLRFWLSDYQFVLAGIFFGALNCIVGYSFGVPYTTWSSKLTIFFGFFLAGFVSGIAAYSLIGVAGFVRGFVASDPILDYREPDKCAGLSFLGEALVKFGLANLIMGVLISLYIVFAPWAHVDRVLVRAMRWIWLGFPFFISLGHLLGLGTVVHLLLQRYKTQMQQALSARVRAVRGKIQAASVVNRTLREELEYELKLQGELYRMNTWPFTFGSTVHYAIGFFVDAVPAYLGALKLIKEAH